MARTRAPASGGEDRPTETQSVLGTLTKVAGAHSLKIGTEFRRYRETDVFFGNNQTAEFNFDSAWTRGPFNNSAAAPGQLGQTFAAFLLGLPTSGSVARPANYDERSTNRFVATPAFHVFEMYAPHVGGQSVRTIVSAPVVRYQRVDSTGSLWGLAGSASIKGRTVTLTAVNPHVSEPRETEIALRGASIASIRADVLRATDIHDVNTFEHPKAIVPEHGRSETPRGNVVIHRFAPASVTRLTIDLG